MKERASCAGNGIRLASVIDALPEHIAILDADGVIVQVNESWKAFSRENNGPDDGGVGSNYIATCDRACGLNAEGADQAARGIHSVLKGEAQAFNLEYPCHAPHQRRWFYMLAAPIRDDGSILGAVVSHFDITARKNLENELQFNEEHYRNLADFATDWEWWVDPQGRFLHVSSSSMDVTGYEAESFINDPELVDRILHPEDRARYQPSMFTKVSPVGRHYDEFRILKPDGEVVWIGHLCRPIYKDDGTWLGRRATNRDITIQKTLEEKLRMDEAIISSTPNLISLVDLNFTYQRVNKSYETHFAVRKEDIVGKLVAEVVGEEVFENIIKERLSRCFQGDTISYDAWFDFPGTGRTCLAVTYYPYRNGEGEILGAVVSGKDITDLKRAQEAQERSERRLKEAQAISHTGNFERDLRTGEGYWSDELYRLLGYPTDLEPSFEHVMQRVHPDDQDQVLTDMESGILSGGETSLEFRVVHPDGGTIHLAGNLVVSFDSKGVAQRYHGVLTDVSNLKEAEAQLVEMANTDYLTGIANRRAFIGEATKELTRSRRYKHPMSLLMLDVDHFKRVNDSYGHDVGDIVLKEVVRLASERLRESDVIGRVGGEEFAVLLPMTDTEGACCVAERIRVNINEAAIPAGTETLKVSVSLGGATFAGGGRHSFPTLQTC